MQPRNKCANSIATVLLILIPSNLVPMIERGIETPGAPCPRQIHHAGPSTKRDVSVEISESVRSTCAIERRPAALGSPVTRPGALSGWEGGEEEEKEVEEDEEKEERAEDREEREREAETWRGCARHR